MVNLAPPLTHRCESDGSTEVTGTALYEEWEMKCLARLFSSLGDPTRLAILRSLSTHGTLCVSDLAEASQLSVSAISHQLRLLRDRELISAKRRGRMVWYSISDDHVSMLLEVGLEHALKDCPKRRARA